MREILFKAKRKDNDKWVEGYYTTRNDKTFIGIDMSIGIDMFEIFCTPVISWLEVDPKTLCQFTGLTDKNGKRIWENDIVMYEGQYAPVKFGLYRQNAYYYENVYGFYVDFPESTLLRKDFGYWNKKVEVVGNVFVNPELLQEEPNE